MKKIVANIIIIGIVVTDLVILSPLFFKVFTNCPIVEDTETMTREDYQEIEHSTETEYGFNPVLNIAVDEVNNMEVIEPVEMEVVESAYCEDIESVEETEIEEPTESDANCTPLKKKTKIKKKYVQYCEEVAKKYKNVDAETLIAMIEKETGGKNQQVKRKKATYQGLTMINPKYQKSRMKKLGIKSLMDEYSNILCCADILQENYDTYGSMRLAIIGFNAGEYSNMFKTAKKNGTSTKYCRWVMNRAKELKK